ncbi:MAG: NAD(P)-binding protein [Deltaproteobacteria bacterium]|nr:NAD(P)-binding protein [Deltaproteobacteria bacterium]
MDPIEIIGGGLSGLAAAVVLARQGQAVTIFEKKRYPCVKLCGEFLSPEGLVALGRVSQCPLPELVTQLELRPTKKFSWVSRRGRTLSVDLEPGGWAVRRDVLDPWLATLASGLGAEVRFGAAGEPTAPRQLWATGKEHSGLKSPYFAIKGYVRESENGKDVLHGRDIVLYQLRGGYIGFTRMQDGALSYCALFDRARTDAAWRYTNWDQLCAGVFTTNSELRRWAPGARVLLASHVGAAMFDFETRAAVREGRWYAGDAVQLVPPFVGDGMSMAIEGGELAARALLLGQSAAEYQAAWRKHFAPRVRTAKMLHPLLWMKFAHEPAISILRRMPGVVQWLYAQTRGDYAA